VAAVFNLQAFLFQVLGMAVEKRRHIFGHTIFYNALITGIQPSQPVQKGTASPSASKRAASAALVSD
jgi:hypothetical protein